MFITRKMTLSITKIKEALISYIDIVFQALGQPLFLSAIETRLL